MCLRRCCSTGLFLISSRSASPASWWPQAAGPAERRVASIGAVGLNAFFNGGGGTNSLTLAGTAGSSDVLAGDIRNFQTLTKTGDGRWTLSGTVGANGGGSPLAVQVQDGTLALTGNNSSFNGTVTVDPAGILEARAQSLPPAVTNNGLVRFAQPDAGTYSGAISGTGVVSKTGAGVLTLGSANSYQGGTLLQDGVVAIAGDNRLGAASGGITFDGGALQLTSSFDLSAGRAIEITANNGRLITDAGVTSTLAQGITGAGGFTKDGAGTLILTGTSSHGGGTTIAAGTLQLGDGGTAGALPSGTVNNNGTLSFNRSDTVSFGNLVTGSGNVLQAGTGTTVLSADNSYAGSTQVSSGALYINGNQSGGTGPASVAPGATLGGIGRSVAT